MGEHEEQIGKATVEARSGSAAEPVRIDTAGPCVEETLYAMRAMPQLERIEAQLMPFSGPIDAPLKEQGFHLFTRQFMLLDLQQAPKATSNSAGSMRMDRWNDRYFEPCRKLIYLSYADHVVG